MLSWPNLAVAAVVILFVLAAHFHIRELWSTRLKGLEDSKQYSIFNPLNSRSGISVKAEQCLSKPIKALVALLTGSSFRTRWLYKQCYLFAALTRLYCIMRQSSAFTTSVLSQFLNIAYIPNSTPCHRANQLGISCGRPNCHAVLNT
jgi:hypothetical protein